MNEETFVDVLGAEIVLTEDKRAIILTKHPEVTEFVDRISLVLSTPDEIHRSIRDNRVVLYYRHELDIFDGKWLVVVVKQIDRNFVSTVYITDKIKSGEVIWTK